MRKVNIKKTLRGIMAIREEAIVDYRQSDFKNRIILVCESYEELTKDLSPDDACECIRFMYGIDIYEVVHIIDEYYKDFIEDL